MSSYCALQNNSKALPGLRTQEAQLVLEASQCLGKGHR